MANGILKFFGHCQGIWPYSLVVEPFPANLRALGSQAWQSQATVVIRKFNRDVATFFDRFQSLNKRRN